MFSTNQIDCQQNVFIFELELQLKWRLLKGVSKCVPNTIYPAFLWFIKKRDMLEKLEKEILSWSLFFS